MTTSPIWLPLQNRISLCFEPKEKVPGQKACAALYLSWAASHLHSHHRSKCFPCKVEWCCHKFQNTSSKIWIWAPSLKTSRDCAQAKDARTQSWYWSFSLLDWLSSAPTILSLVLFCPRKCSLMHFLEPTSRIEIQHSDLNGFQNWGYTGAPGEQTVTGFRSPEQPGDFNHHWGYMLSFTWKDTIHFLEGRCKI